MIVFTVTTYFGLINYFEIFHFNNNNNKHYKIFIGISTFLFSLQLSGKMKIVFKLLELID